MKLFAYATVLVLLFPVEASAFDMQAARERFDREAYERHRQREERRERKVDGSSHIPDSIGRTPGTLMVVPVDGNEELTAPSPSTRYAIPQRNGRLKEVSKEEADTYLRERREQNAAEKERKERARQAREAERAERAVQKAEEDRKEAKQRKAAEDARKAELARWDSQEYRLEYLLKLEASYKKRVHFESAKAEEIVRNYNIDCRAKDGRFLPLLGVLYARHDAVVQRSENKAWLETFVQERDGEVRIIDSFRTQKGTVGDDTLVFQINKWGELRPVSISHEAVRNACFGFQGPIWLK
jgi:hypothetical protein